jgi:RNA polymerase sigma-70 factor (ECF subfamily)
MKSTAVETGAAELLVRFYDHNDEDALSEFFLRFKDLAFRIAYNVLNNTADAEDITQQTFVQLLKKQAICKAAYDGDDYKVKSWLLAVIYNASRMQYNAKKKNKTYELTEGANVESPNTYESEANSDKDGVISKLNKAIFDLPEKYRVPILMRYHQDMSIDDISKTLAAQPSTIRSILSRGVSLLRDKLSNEKITLSSVAAIELIGNIPYPVPHQEISMGLIKSIKSSNPHVVKAIKSSQAKASLLLKSAIAVTFVATAGAVLFLINKNEIKEQTSISQKISTPITNTEPKSHWNFAIDNDSDFTPIQSNLVYVPELKAFSNKIEKDAISNSAIVKLPLKFVTPTKITIISKVTPTRGKYSQPLFNSLEFIPIIEKNPILGKLIYHNKYSFSNVIPKNDFIAQFNHVFYLFDNVCITTKDDGVILKVHRYDDLKENPSIGFILANMAIEKVDVEKLSDKEHKKIEALALDLLNKQQAGLDAKAK